jgi:glucose/mannose transport system substrate-binding protein
MKKNQRFRQQILIVAMMTVIILIIGGALIYFSMQKNSNVLVFYHWWTSAGEKEALNSLINVFTEEYPNVTVIPTSVTGGAGYAMLRVIKPLVIAREAPDAFQMHAGYEGKPYFDAGLLESVDNIWKSENLEKVIPRLIQVMCQFKGHYYSVPMDIHRTNVIWYNKKILNDNKINPANLTNWDEFFNACDKIRNSGIQYPIQMGTDWTAAHVFEQIVASQGIDFYQDWVNGNVTSPEDARLLKSLEIFKRYMQYVNLDHATLEWNDATGRIINGEGAFNLMGDWAEGEFKNAKMEYNRDYGEFPVPKTGNMYGLCIDTFQRPKYIQHPINSERWLKVISSKEGQDAFNSVKGSISVRKDTNLTRYGLYQQSAIFDFVSVKYMFPSIVHGSGAPESFRLNLTEIMADFTRTLDVNKTAIELTDYTKKIKEEYTIIWELN